LIILDPKDNEILQLNQQALNAGINLNMSLGSAAALDRNLQVVHYQPQIEKHTVRSGRTLIFTHQ
jgi:protein ImuB